jgi:TonB family protein
VETAPLQNTYPPTDFEAELPAIAASTDAIESPVAVVPEAQTKIAAKADLPATRELPASLFEAVKPAAPPVASAPLKSPVSSPASLSGAASAPAPAKETPAPAEKKSVIAPSLEQSEPSAPTFGMTGMGSSPSFSALDREDSGGGGGKKILIAAAVVLVAAALGYFGWTKLNPSRPSTQTSAPSESVSTPYKSAPATPVSDAPVASANTASTSSTSPTIAPQSSKPSANIGTPTIPASTGTDADTKKSPASPAIVVKSYKAGKSHEQSDDAAPQLPNPMAVASPDKNLTGLISSVPAPLPRPTMATLKISQGVSQGLLIKRVQPRYPQNALSMRVQGAVQMEATINKEGNISNLKVLSGDAVLARAATEAVKQWRYKPYFLNGEPVEIQTQITVNFRLPN